MAGPEEKPETGPSDQLTEQLVAYLDGELHGKEAAVVEARLRVDPKARAEVAVLKQTWELLDHLPKLEPSPSFTEKTVEKLGPVAGATRGMPARAASQADKTVPSQQLLRQTSQRNWLFPSFLAGIAVLALLVGYLFRGLVAEPAKSRQRQEERQAQQEEKWKDQRLLKNLKYYRNTDDLEFAQALDTPELFGEEPMP